MVIEADRARREEAIDLAKLTAWHSAHLYRVKAEAFPRDLRQFLKRRPAKAQTARQQQAILHMLAARFGKLEKLDEPTDFSKWERLRARGEQWAILHKRKGNA